MRHAFAALLLIAATGCAVHPIVGGRYASRSNSGDIAEIKRALRDRPHGVDAFDWAPVHKITFDAPDRASVELFDERVLTFVTVYRQRGHWLVDVSSIHTEVLVTS